MKLKNKLIIMGILLIIILIIISIIIFRAQKSADMWGDVPSTSQSETSETTGAEDTTIPSLPYEHEDQPPLIYPEEVDFWEESLTGGGTPQTYTDGDGNEYTKTYFPSFGYAMFIPDGWTRINPSTSYLNNSYFLVTDKENYENIQISISTKTGTKGLSPSQVRNLFKTTQNNMEYYYSSPERYKMVTSLYTQGDIHQITTADIPGFEMLEENQILAYYDEPAVTFVMDLEPTYYTNPYVINYYLIKDDVAVMLTLTGPKKNAGQMNYLLATMGLNCKELYNTNATDIHYSSQKEISSKIISIAAPEDWYINGSDEYGVNIICSDDESNHLFGTEFQLSNKICLDSSSDPKEILSDNNVLATLTYSAINGYAPELTRSVLNNLNFSVKYAPSDISTYISNQIEYTKIDYTITVDETSLWQTLSLIDNPIHSSIYIFKCKDGYAFINVRYLARNESYITNLVNNVLGTVEIE